MTGRDDLGLSLPDPPPPAPARREAAIEAALARFDGAPRAAQAAHLAKRRFWRPMTQRPYLGTALALSLLALVVAPVAWMEMPQREPPTSLHMESPPQGQRDAGIMAVPAPPAEVQQEPPAVEAEQSPDQSTSAPPAMAEAPAPDPSPSPHAEQKASQPDAPAPAPTAQVMTAPPPPAPATTANASLTARRSRMASESEEARDVVVTGMRADPALLRGRGDWNACTVQDPERDLGLCKKLVGPRAKGGKTSADAQIADGLALAWAGDWDGAIAAFGKAIAIAPKSSDAYLNRGLAYQARGDEDRALADLDKAVRYAPYAARGYYNRGQLHKQRGDERRAETDRNRAAELDSRYAP